MTAVLLFVLYALAGAGVAVFAAFLRRPIERRALVAAFALPIVFLAPGFFLDRTALPVDQARTIPPWQSLGPVAVARTTALRTRRFGIGILVLLRGPEAPPAAVSC